MKHHHLLLLVIGLAAAPGFSAEIPMVRVGNAGNAAHPETGRGAVPYEFKIGRTEVTNDQYAEFLNAVAEQSDPYGLFHPLMSSSERGGIRRAGEEGKYRYESKPGRGLHPVNFLSWYQAARFVNWLNNGQGNADTESGAYLLNGATNGRFERQSDARFWIPSSDEWYKAAYYQPEQERYSTYATGSDLPPVAMDPNEENANSGNLLRPREEAVRTTPVGSYPASLSAYGTCDQAGNLLEYSEEFVEAGDLLITVWGGDYDYGAAYTAAAGKEANPARIFPSHSNDTTTLRVAGEAE